MSSQSVKNIVYHISMMNVTEMIRPTQYMLTKQMMLQLLVTCWSDQQPASYNQESFDSYNVSVSVATTAADCHCASWNVDTIKQHSKNHNMNFNKNTTN